MSDAAKSDLRIALAVNDPIRMNLSATVTSHAITLADQLEAEAEDLEARAMEKRVEAFRCRNHARLANRMKGES